jgi:hypothetical protein
MVIMFGISLDSQIIHKLTQTYKTHNNSIEIVISQYS